MLGGAPSFEITTLPGLVVNITWSRGSWVTWINDFGLVTLTCSIFKIGGHSPAGKGYTDFWNIIWSLDRSKMLLSERDPSHKSDRKNNKTFTANLDKLLLEIETQLFHYKLGQMLSQVGQLSCHILGQLLLKVVAGITNKSNRYYEMGNNLL